MKHKPPRVAINVRLDASLLEALNETAEELVVSRNLLVETAVRQLLERMGDLLVAAARGGAA